MAAHDFDDLLWHVGHEIECVTYGQKDAPWNVAVECLTCQEVLLDFDAETSHKARSSNG